MVEDPVPRHSSDDQTERPGAPDALELMATLDACLTSDETWTPQGDEEGSPLVARIERCLSALTDLGAAARDAIPALIRALRDDRFVYWSFDSQRSTWVHERAATILRRLRNDATAALVEVRHDPDPDLRKRADEILDGGRQNTPAYVLRSAQNRLGVSLDDVLARGTPAERRLAARARHVSDAALRAALDDEDGPTRATAAAALWRRTAEPRCLDALIALLADGVPLESRLRALAACADVRPARQDSRHPNARAGPQKSPQTEAHAGPQNSPQTEARAGPQNSPQTQAHAGPQNSPQTDALDGPLIEIISSEAGLVFDTALRSILLRHGHPSHYPALAMLRNPLKTVRALGLDILRRILTERPSRRAEGKALAAFRESFARASADNLEGSRQGADRPLAPLPAGRDRETAMMLLYALLARKDTRALTACATQQLRETLPALRELRAACRPDDPFFVPLTETLAALAFQTVVPAPLVPMRRLPVATESLRLELLSIPGGACWMSDPDADSGDPYCDSLRGQRHVRVAPFYLGRTPVTQTHWIEIMGENPAHDQRRTDLPVDNVTFDQVHEFCRRLSARVGLALRLPSEAEWEYACRAGREDEDDDASAVAWHAGNSGGTTHPVGYLRPNAFGLHDMHGNVHEWCEDLYGSYEYAPQDETPQRRLYFPNPYRVIRGGNFRATAAGCRCGTRAFVAAGEARDMLGFRLAMDVSPPPRRMPPLHAAAVAGDSDTIARLLAEGEAIDECDEARQTALMHAVIAGHETAVELLLQRSAHRDAMDAGDWTALQLAARQGYLAIARRLLQAGADPDQARDGRTPLLIACVQKNPAMIQLLLSQGARADRGPCGGHSPLTAILSDPPLPALVAPLLRAGAGCYHDYGGVNGEPALHLAAAAADCATATLLLDAGARIDQRDRWRRTPLMRAAASGDAAITRLLLDRGANPRLRDDEGRSAVRHAVGAAAALL